MKVLLIKSKTLYIQYAWIYEIMKKQNSNQNVKIDYYHHKFNFGNFFSCPVKPKEFETEI